MAYTHSRVTRSDTRLRAFASSGGRKVATHPVAQLSNKLMPVAQPLQHPHRSLPKRARTFHTTYDALGRRIYRADPWSLPSSFSYDGDNLLLSNWSGSVSTVQNGPGIDNKLSVKSAGGSSSTYYHFDHLGTTTGTS